MSVNNDHISALERLAKLRADGTLSEAEFEAQKAQLFAVQFVSPIHRRLWVVVTLTALIFTFWVALAILASGEVYRKQRGGWVALTKGSRWTYAGFLAVWLLALVAKTIVQPNYWDLEPGQAAPSAAQKNSATPSPEKPAAAAVTPSPAPESTIASSDGPPSCTDPKFRQTVLEAITDAFDKAGLPREPEIEQATNELIELDGPMALTVSRSVAANSDGQLKVEEVRVCGTKDQYGGAGIVTVIVVQHDGEVGGAITNTGLPSPIPFGKQF
jgi:hypothetical protein